LREVIDVAARAAASAEGAPPSEDNDSGLAALLIGFLGTPAGQALNTKLADWIGAQNDGNRARHKRDTTELHWRYALMVLVIVIAAGLTVGGKLDSTIVGFLGLALGYLFGRSQKTE
jgi:hypothetical protein